MPNLQTYIVVLNGVDKLNTTPAFNDVCTFAVLCSVA